MTELTNTFWKTCGIKLESLVVYEGIRIRVVLIELKLEWDIEFSVFHLKVESFKENIFWVVVGVKILD